LNSDLYKRGSELLYDTTVCVFTLNRFELSRATILSVLAFAPTAGRVLVIDDCSDDIRLTNWLRVLARHDLIELVERMKKRNIGHMYRMLAKNYTGEHQYLVSLDNDVLVGPDALQVLVTALEHWESYGVAMLGSFGCHLHPPQSNGEVWQMLDRYMDSPLFVVRSDVFGEMWDDIKPSRRRPFVRFSKKLRARKLRRSLQVNPRVNAIHLGAVDSTMNHSVDAFPPGLYGWFDAPCSPLPDLDVKDCEQRYPKSVWEIGTRLRDRFMIRDKYMNGAIQDALVIADKECGYNE